MDLTTLIILIGATWRISNLLVSESGPFEFLTWLRHKAGVRHNQYNQAYALSEFAEVFTCLWCMSVWAGLIATILYWYAPIVTIWLCLPFALSAGAILIKGALDG